MENLPNPIFHLVKGIGLQGNGINPDTQNFLARRATVAHASPNSAGRSDADVIAMCFGYGSFAMRAYSRHGSLFLKVSTEWSYNGQRRAGDLNPIAARRFWFIRPVLAPASYPPQKV